MKRLVSILLMVFCLAGAWSCSKPDKTVPDWPWTDPEKPEPKPDPEPEPEPLFKGKPRYVWIDASANFQYYANSKDQIAADLKKIKGTGFTDVIVDVRPTEGVVLYKSKVAPEAKKLPAWVGSQYKMIERTETFDYLQAFIDAGHAVGLRVNAAINTFVGGSGGYYGLESIGPIFTGEIPSTWATVINSVDGLVSTYYKGVAGTVFLNPADNDVQEYMLKIIAEIAEYDVDGIILDRCRFDDNGLQCEFSDVTRKKFEQYYGSKVTNWPTDVMKAGATALPTPITDIFRSWMSFRVKVIHDFVEKAAAKVHEVDKNVRFGCYVGAWYSSYYTSGVNWASPKHNAQKNYKWANADYSTYGFADHCDFMMLGCYAGTTSVYGSGEWTMQGFAKQGKSLLCGDCVCAGGPDVGNSPGFEKGGQDDIIPQTIDACINAADGYFVFDLCHIRMYDYWKAFKKGIDDYLNTL